MARPPPFNLQLHKEIDHWQSEGLVTADLAAQLRQRYPETGPGAANQLLATALAVAGSLLVGLGIVLIFGYNWNSLGKATRLGLAFAPLAAALCSLAFALGRRPSSTAWREAAAVGACIAAAACLGLVGQTLQLQSSFPDFCFTWQIICLAFLWAARSRAVFCLCCGLGIVVASASFADASSWRLAVGIGVCFVYIWQERRRVESRLSMLAFGANAVVALPAIASSFLANAWDLVTVAMVCAIFYLWDSRRELAMATFGKRPCALLGKIGLTIIVFIGSYEGAWRSVSPSPGWDALASLFLAAAAIAYLWLVYDRARSGSRMELWWAVIPLLGAIAVVLRDAAGIEPIVLSLAASGYALALAIAAIADGYRAQSAARLNHGLLLLIALILLRFFDGGMGMLSRGIAFIALGALFLYANFHFLQRRKALSHENK